MTTAFVLSGGASLGAAQVGVLAALVENGVRPDLIVGSSVGALNGCWLAARSDPDGIAALGALWRSLTRSSVFPARPMRAMLGVVGRSDHLVSNRGLRRILLDNLSYEHLEDAPTPLHVIATDLLSGADVRLSSGSAVQAVLASAAIPSVFPPVVVDGRALVDGGIVNNTPISHAVQLGADRIWVVSTGNACALPAAPMAAIGIGIQALTLAINQRLARDVERYEPSVDLRVVPPLCPVHTSPVDFSQSDDLIARAFLSTRNWLAAGPPDDGQARLLEPHDHSGSRPV